MATVHLDGTDDRMHAVGQGPMNGVLTMAALVRRYDLVYGTLISPHPSWTWFIATSPGEVALYFGGASKSAANVNTMDWYLLAVTLTAISGTWYPRFHIKNITTDAAWIHADSVSGKSGVLPSAVGQTLMTAERSGLTGFLKADYAIAAWWDGIALNDVQIEMLAVNKKTSDWDIDTVEPSSLTEFNTSVSGAITATDLKGLVTWSTAGNPVLTGPDPTGWTFDGLGAPPEPEPEPSEPPVRIRTASGWVSLNDSGGGGIEFYEQLETPDAVKRGAIWLRREPE